MEKKYLIAAFYKFVSFPDYVSRQTEILKFCIEKSIKEHLILQRINEIKEKHAAVRFSLTKARVKEAEGLDAKF